MRIIWGRDGKWDFDTAIDAMTMLLSGFDVYGKGKEREDD